MSNGIGHVWAVNAEGGDQGRPNGVGPVWIENADQLGTKLPEPESGDTGKVLGVLNSDGDIGWVPDQEGMAQVQADWDQTDSSQVSYIANKPSLATVATTGAYSDLSGTPTIPTVDQEYNSASANAQSGVAVASAISGKQDTINDLETIRSGAAAGATAVQPAALNDYATTSALTSGLSTKQDTISDLETIRSGAAAGATAVQPNSLATVATTGNYSDLSGKPTIPTVDQTYNAASANAQSGTAVAGALATVDEVPDVTSSDNGKVLKASYSQGEGSYAWSNENFVPAVQTTDNNKVLKAFYSEGERWYEWANESAPTYTAGDGIRIVGSTLSSNIDTKGLKFTSQSIDLNLATNSGLTYAQQQATSSLTVGGGTGSTYNGTIRFNVSDLNNYLDSATSGQTFTLTIPANLFAANIPMYPGDTILFVFSNRTATGPASGKTQSYIDVTDQISYTSDPDEMTTTINACTITLPAYLYSSAGWSSDVASHTFGYFAITVPDQYFYSGSGSVTASYTGAPSGLKVSNPLPASTPSDSGKVLKVDANGDPEWGVGGAQADWTETDNTDPSYVQNKPDVLSFVAGSGISITENASSITIAADAQLPSYNTTTDVGKVLQVTANGLEWVSLS